MKIIKPNKLYLGLLLASSAFAAQAAEPLSFKSALSPGNLQQYVMPKLDNVQLIQRDAQARKINPDTPILRYAEPLSVSITPKRWQTTSTVNKKVTTPMSVWRTRIVSSDALSLNLGFAEYSMPEGGSLHIYTPDQSQRIRPFTAADNDSHGQLWTPMIKGDVIIVEVNVPTAKIDELKLRLSSVNHGYLGGSMDEVDELLSGSCNVDSVCSQGDGWRAQIRSEARITVNGSSLCSGTALNNTANDGKGFFLTAYHCGIRSNNAASVVAYWNYENSYCRTPDSSDSGSSGDGVLTNFSSGTTFRAGYSPADMTLIEFDDPFDPAHSVYLAGWNVGSSPATSAVAIHHPSGHEKRISFENEPTSITSYSRSSSPGDSTHIRVADWDLGTTQPGSSGSGLFDQDKRVVGQLHGGGAACGNDQADWYGWLNASWTGSGSDNTRLQNWLDPLNSGQIAIDGREANDTGGNMPPVARITASCNDLSCSFDGSSSTDNDGSVVSYQWNLGDNSNVNGANVQHTYASSNTYTVSLTVTDNSGATHTMTENVAVSDGNTSDSELQSGVPVNNLAAAKDGELLYFINTSKKDSDVAVQISGGSGDADLYVKTTSEPSKTDYDCRPYVGGNNESCHVTMASPGKLYIKLIGYSAFSGTSLVATTTGGASSDFPKADLSATQGDWQRFTYTVPQGVSQVVVTSSGGTGDADLYVKKGSAPSTSAYDCRPYNEGNNESCTVSVNSGEVVHLGLNAFRAYSGVTLDVK
ncbi:MAG: lysyl endopeptidase [Phenylobacterium sp.]|jgi:lysyl endopeptidase